MCWGFIPCLSPLHHSYRWKLWLPVQEGLWRGLQRLAKHSAFPVLLPFVCFIECFLKFNSHIDILSQSLDKLSKGDPQGLGRVCVSICVLLFPSPCTGMYRFSTGLVSIWRSLLHPVVSPWSQARGWRHLPSVKKRGLVLELIVRMGDSPAVGDRANWQWEPRLSQLLVRPRGTNMGNWERWLEEHLSAGSQGREWMSLQWCFVLLWNGVVDKGAGLFHSLAGGLWYCHCILSAAALDQEV